MVHNKAVLNMSHDANGMGWDGMGYEMRVRWEIIRKMGVGMENEIGWYGVEIRARWEIRKMG